MLSLREVLAWLTLVSVGYGFKRYQTEIPNGHHVPHPCNTSMTWGGVGHVIPAGHGRRNAFGIHFQQHGKKWTRELCQLDSDMDGRTNGDELGDPDCVWSPGQTPSRVVDISHPGVCEPMTSEKCLKYNTWTKCYEKEFHCDLIADPATKSMTIRLPPTKIPDTQATNYYCMMFQLNLTETNHLIAVEPVLDNMNIVHHMLLFGCTPAVSYRSGPYPCDMVPNAHCTQIIGTWTMGSKGECIHENAGFNLSPRNYRTVALQVHWNNPTLLSGLTDSSGLRVYYTPKLRMFNAGVLVVGMEYLQIDPMTMSPDTSDIIEYSTTCPSRCTKAMFESKIYITTAINHMHYRGYSQRMELFRNGTKLRDITYDRFYEYDNPIIYSFRPPIEVERGDEIKTTCVYQRPPDGKPVCYGEATDDEMCFGFITYYPFHKMDTPWCVSRKSIQHCDRHFSDRRGLPIDNCDYIAFLSSANIADMYSRLQKACTTLSGQTYVVTSRSCAEATCIETMREIMKQPCMKGDITSYITFKIIQKPFGYRLLNLLVSCDCDHITNFEYCERRVNEYIVIGENKTFKCANENISAGTHVTSILCLLVLPLWFIYNLF